MSRFELYSPEGLRIDGRRFNELRMFRCNLGSHSKSADGSASVEMGTSKVVCTVHGPQDPSKRSRMNHDRSVLTVNLIMAPFSSTERSKHATNERSSQEMCINLKETFESVVITRFAPATEIVVNLNILAQDGNLLASCVNAMCLAFIDAGVPMLEYISCVAVAVYQDTPLLDPNHIETTELPNLSVGVVGKSAKVSLLVLERRLLVDNLEATIELGIEGCKIVRQIMDQEVRKRLNQA